MAFAIKSNTDKYDWTATKRMFEVAKIGVEILNEKIILNNIHYLDLKTTCFLDKLASDFELMSTKMKEIAKKIRKG
jgi:hypothetical protein